MSEEKTVPVEPTTAQPAAEKPIPPAPAEPPEEKAKPTPPPSKADDRISQANTAAARMEEANKKFEELIVRQEAMKVEEALGGKTDAGQTQEKKEVSPEDYAKKVMANDLPEPPK